MENITLEEYIESLSIELNAAFIPQLQSRNAKEHPSLNWKITLKINNMEFVCDYMQGIGHIPGWQNISTNLRRRNEVETPKSGRYYTTMNQFHSIKLVEPNKVDILYSLVLDADVLNYRSFEDWAENFGYSTDSIKAKATYQECLSQTLNLRSLLGLNVINKLTKLFENY